MTIKKRNFQSGILLKPDDVALEGKEGEIKVGDTSKKIETHIDGQDREIITNDQAQSLENKTIDGTSATGNNTVTADATNITYDNSTSGIAATNSQDAIDNVEGRVDVIETGLGDNDQDIADLVTLSGVPVNSTDLGTFTGTTITDNVVEKVALQELETAVETKAADADLTAHINDVADAHAASAVSNTPSGNLAATDVQGALNEHQGDIDTLTTGVSDNATAISDHIADPTDAHTASAITNVASGNLVATDVQGALDELQTDVDTRALDSDLTAHINDVADAHAASAITNTPSGNLAATDIQGAVDELQTDVDTRALDADLTSHVNATAAHGTTGDVVGTTDTQTLTNKTISGASIQTPSRSDVKQDTEANLEVYAGTATNGQLCFATDTKLMFQVVDAALVPVGSGSGGGLDNFFLEDMDKFDVVDAQTGNNADFLGGGTLAGTLAKETVSPISGDESLKFTQASGSLNDYVSISTIDLDPKQIGNSVSLIQYFEYDGEDGDLQVVIYDVTNSAELSNSQFELTSEASAKRFSGSVNVPSDCLQIAIGFKVVVENIGAILVADDFEMTTAPREVKEFTVTNSISVFNSDGRTVTADTEDVFFSGSGTGWTGGADNSPSYYEVQYNDSIVDLVTSVGSQANVSVNSVFIYKNGVLYKRISGLRSYVTSAWNGTYISRKGEFVKGDQLSIRTNATITTGLSDTTHYLNIVETAQSIGTVFASDTDNEFIIDSSYQTTDTTSTGVLTDLTTPLVVGKKYLVTGQIRLDSINASDNQKSVSWSMYDGATKISGGRFGNSNNFDWANVAPINKTFTATSTSLTVEADGYINAQITGGAHNTFVDVTELPNATVDNIIIENFGNVVAASTLGTGELENVFSARILNNGTASIGSESSSFIQSVTRSSLGVIDVVFTPSFFSVAPSVVIEGVADDFTWFSNLSETGFSISTYASSSNYVDRNVNIVLQRQGSDYKSKANYIDNLIIENPNGEFETVFNRLTSDVSADNLDITDLHFENLEVGAKYLLTGQVNLDSASNSNNQLRYFSGSGGTGTQYGVTGHLESSTSYSRPLIGVSQIIDAVSTDLYVRHSGTLTIYSGATRDGTFLELTKLPKQLGVDQLGQVVTNHVTGGTEYEIKGQTWNGKQIYARSYEWSGSSSSNVTIDTLPAGLTPVNITATTKVGATDKWYTDYTGDGSFLAYANFVDTTGLLALILNGSTFNESRITIKYTKP